MDGSSNDTKDCKKLQRTQDCQVIEVGQTNGKGTMSSFKTQDFLSYPIWKKKKKKVSFKTQANKISGS